MSREKPQAPAPGLAEAPGPREDADRASLLESFGFETLQDDSELEAITHFAGELCGAPIALVSIVEEERQLFLARTGLEASETPRSVSFCAHAMLGDAPLVITDAAQDPRFSDNALVTGPPHIRFYAGVPLQSRQGVPLGALCVIDTVARPGGLTPLQRNGLEVLAQAVMRRLTARRAGLAATLQAAESTRAMREIADRLPVVVWAADHEGRFDYFNDRWTVVTGQPRPVEVADWRRVVHPDDAAAAFSAWADSIAKGKLFESEYRLRQLDGTWRWTLSRALPLHDREGKVVRWFGTLTDVDSGHRESEGRELLARELSHRIKNIFAVVAGLVALRARRRPEVAAFAEELSAAIRALGRAHDFVRPVEGVKGDSLVGLLTELMAPYAAGEERVVITGPDCAIGPRAATPLALVFHELATNAAKYGALSVEGGSVAIAVDCQQADGIARVRWRERSGPAVEEPGSEGFGSRLLAMAVEGQLGGKFERRYADSGLEIDLEIPMSGIGS